MNIEMRAIGFRLTEGLKTFIQEHLIQALARRAEYVREVVVRLSEQPDHRGGIDKLCRIQVDLMGRRLQFAEAIRPEAQAAVLAASRRAGRIVNRYVERSSY